jgi:endoglucanase
MASPGLAFAAKAPAAPTNVRASNITDSSILLSWNAAPRAKSYDVNLGSYQSSTTGTSFNFTQLTPCMRYTLGVRSRNRSGTSAWVNVTAQTSGCNPPPPPPPSSGLHVSGNQLLDANGNAIRLHGVDRSGTEYACIQGWGIFDGPNLTNDDSQVPLIASWKANSVTIGLNEDCWLGINGVPSAYGGQNYINAVVHEVRTLESYGIYPVLALHWSAPGTTPATGQSAMPDNDHTPAFWQSVAKTFTSDPNVIFRLKEEPYPGGNSDSTSAWQCWSSGDVQYGASGSLTPVSRVSHCSEGYPTVGMQSLINIIRGTGARNVIQVPGVQYANSMTHFLDSGIRVTDTLSPPQLMGDVDVYPDFNACGSTTCYQSEYAPVIQQMPFVAGETGTDNEIGCPLSNVNTFLNWMDQHGAGYMGWEWDAWGDCASLISDYSGTANSGWGVDYKNHLASAP